MKTKKVLRLVIFFSILMVMNLLVFAVDSEKQASNFQSNGDLIDGWYWLRDSALQNYAEWKFENISPGTEDLVLDITALATDRPNGGSGFKAKFKLIYGFPGSGNMGGVFKTKIVTLPNVSPPNDPLGYACQGQVTVDREFISGASTIVFRVERELTQDNHVAFKKESIVLLTEEAGEGQFLEGNQLPETNELEGATLIPPGTYTGCLGEEPVGGQIDDNDYYSISLEEGQQITLQLTIPGNASYGISLLTPTTHYDRGSVTTQGGMKTLDYVADSTGTWYIRITRSSGEGDYQLSIDIQDQNDAASGQDAGKSTQEAIPVSPGTITGFLKAGDECDYYSIDLEEGQQITLQLTIPGNASYGISLLTPTTHYDRGSVTTQGGMKTLDYVADSTGTWYIKVSLSSGEGDYQLAIDIQDQNDAESGQDAGDSYQGAIPISTGTITGLLKAGDNVDYFSIDLEEGQQITLQLTIPGNAQYSISLWNPNHNSRGSSITQREIKILDYVADSTGTWYIKVSLSSGEGDYQLEVNASIDNEGGPDNNPPVISSLDASQNSVEVNQAVTITCSASDQDTETFTFSWSVNGEIIQEESSSLNWNAPDTAGTYNISCTVSDGRGGEDSESVSIEVTEPGNGENDNIGEVNYRIEITTGTRIAAGTDANVYITIYDKDGHDSGEILLDDPGVNDFEIGDTNIFSVTAINIENLDYIIIRHDNSGNFPGWYVDEIQVSNEEINKEWTFFPDQWLSTDEPPDYQTQGKFYPQEETVEDNVEYVLSLTNNGRTLTSNLPIFVSETEKGSEIDLDGDGIQQQWEDKAIEYINPYIELDEEEPWLQHQDSDYVANYIRVHPYDPFSTSTTFNSANLPKYIIFRYVVTWSQDYGRQSYGGVNFDIWTSHPGDHERVFMAWKVIDSNTLKLDWVFTSSHGDPDAHHAVWNASYRTCNKGDVATWPPKEYDHSEVFCGELQFNEDGRLVIYASEGKHALYPSCDICDNKVMLVDLPGPVNVGEDCGGGGRFRFDCYNVGEPPNLTDPKVHDLDPKLDTFKNDLPDILINKLKSHYRISINTSDRDLAGTDAEIQIKLFGENNMNSQWFTVYSKSDPPRLASHVGTFERGDKDNIIIECSDLGKIIKIQIKHDNSGLGPGWHINEIWVENLETNTTWHSRPNTWLDKVLWNDNTDKTFNLE